MIEIGTIVRVTAPGSRGDEGETRQIPAIVTRIWPDGSLELFAFHFEGSFLIRSAPRDSVEVVGGFSTPAPKYALMK